jgi:hypothetical protein
MSLLEQASLVITPNAYKESKLYSVVPNTTLGDMDVVRATTATRVNSNGLIEEVPYNLVRYSEDISNSAWAKYNITMSANSTTAPNGTLTAEKLLSSNSTSFQGIEIQVNYISGQKYTNSIYFKYIDTPFVQIITPSFVSSNYVNFNIQTGEVVGGVYEDATVTSVGNGWYRCSFTFISNYTGSGGTIGSANLINSASSSKASDFTGNGVKGIYLWGAQLVTSTSAKEYFPTTDRLNIPRIDYTNGSCPSLLVEPQRTNLLTYSEQFDNEVWQKRSNIAITVNAITAPDGTLTADKMYLSNNLTVDYGCFQIVTSGTNRTLSVYAKKAELNYLFLGFNNNTASEGVFFNLNNGTISQNTGSFTASIENFSNGWYRCSVLFPSISYCFISPSVTGTSFVFNNQQNNGLYIWGAQIEAGAYQTSYIPTVASSVTRNADVISKTGISSLIGQTEGTLFAEFYHNGQDVLSTQQVLFVSSGNTNNYLAFGVYDGRLNPAVRASSTDIFDLLVGPNPLSQGRHKVALAYKSGDFAVYLDGVSIYTNTNSATFGTMSQLDLGTTLSFNTQLGDGIKSAQLYKTRLTNSELAQLTTI